MLHVGRDGSLRLENDLKLAQSPRRDRPAQLNSGRRRSSGKSGAPVAVCTAFAEAADSTVMPHRLASITATSSSGRHSNFQIS